MKKGSITMFQIPPLMVFEYEGDMNKLLKHVEDLEYVRGGYESESTEVRSRSKSSYVLDDDNLKELKQFCLNSVNEYVDEVIGIDDEIEIQQSWVNYNKPGQFQQEHYHPNSFISGVFYLMSDPEKGAPITFKSDLHKSNFSVHMIQKDQRSFYPSAAYSFGYPSVSGQLILFSSTVTHMVPTNNSNTNRISLSFNTYPKVPFGNEGALTRVGG